MVGVVMYIQPKKKKSFDFFESEDTKKSKYGMVVYLQSRASRVCAYITWHKKKHMERTPCIHANQSCSDAASA